MQPAFVGAGDGKQQAADLRFFAAAGQVAEFFDQQTADGIGFFAAQIGAEKSVDVGDFGGCFDTPALGGNGKNIVGAFVFVELVFDFADDLFDQVFKGQKAADAAVFVHHDHHVVALLLQLGEQGVQAFALRYEHGGAQDVFQPEMLGIQSVLEQVFGVQDAEYVVFVVGDYRKARMGGFNGITDDALDAVGGFDDVHARAANHRVAHAHAAEAQHVFQLL